MKFKMILAAVAFAATQSVFAASQEPAACPSISAVKSVGVSSTYHDEERGTWLGVEWKNKYNTDFEWTFGIGEFDSDTGDVSKVLEQANKSISYLSEAAAAPMKGTDEKGAPAWICYYQGSRGVYGVSITPAVTPQYALKTMRTMRR